MRRPVGVKWVLLFFQTPAAMLHRISCKVTLWLPGCLRTEPTKMFSETQNGELLTSNIP